MFCYFLDFGHTSGICGLLLLKGLVLGKSQSHSLRHFDVSSGTKDGSDGCAGALRRMVVFLGTLYVDFPGLHVPKRTHVPFSLY